MEGSTSNFKGFIAGVPESYSETFANRLNSILQQLIDNDATLNVLAIHDSDISIAEGFLRKVSSGVYTAVKSNLSAAVAPTANEDSGDGYSVGSIWIDTTADNAYVCVDATVGAAVWLQYMKAAESSKLAGIEALADVTDATNVAAAGAVMDSDIAAAEGFLRKTGAGTYEGIKSNLTAAVAPTVDEDSGDGYGIGSIWIDTTADNAYVCVDDTVGAAVWLQYMKAAESSKLAGIEVSADVTDATNVAAAGAVMDSDIVPGEGILRKTGAGTYTAIKTNLAAAVAPTANDDNVSGYGVGSLWCDTTADKVYTCIDASTGAAVWHQMITQAEAARVTNLGVSKLYVENYTCIADDDTANYHDFVTGFGVAPDGWNIQIFRAGVNVMADAIVTALGGGDAGKIRVADGGATYTMTAGDVVMVMAWDKV